ncbi:MAG: hypothetical protein H8E85_01090 [Candidatus Marinimicrobia bacterium]|nr:hypothetical protein [Candidatus Neomarinimicrobiota bacterium]
MIKIQKQFIFGALLIFLGCQNSNYNWYSGNFEDAKSVAGTKLIMLDFYTDT